MTVTIFPKFITPEECNELNSWALDALSKGWLSPGIMPDLTPSAINRFSTVASADRFDKYPNIVYRIRERIILNLDLGGLDASVTNGGKNGTVVLVVKPTGSLFAHRDFVEPNGNHLLRCNVITQAAESGGELFVDDRDGVKQKINTGVAELHCYVGSKYEHTSTTINGNSPRIIWMFGFQLPANDPRFSLWT